jgi:hypothetical protein
MKCPSLFEIFSNVTSLMKTNHHHLGPWSGCNQNTKLCFPINTDPSTSPDGPQPVPILTSSSFMVLVQLKKLWQQGEQQLRVLQQVVPNRDIQLRERPRNLSAQQGRFVVGHVREPVDEGLCTSRQCRIDEPESTSSTNHKSASVTLCASRSVVEERATYTRMVQTIAVRLRMMARKSCVN